MLTRHVLLIEGIADQGPTLGIHEAHPDRQILQQRLQALAFLGEFGEAVAHLELTQARPPGRRDAAQQRGATQRPFEDDQVGGRRRQLSAQEIVATPRALGIGSQQYQRDIRPGGLPLQSLCQGAQVLAQGFLGKDDDAGVVARAAATSSRLVT